MMSGLRAKSCITCITWRIIYPPGDKDGTARVSDQCSIQARVGVDARLICILQFTGGLIGSR